MTVREATTADIEAIRRVAEASWKADYPDILSRESLEDGFDEWYSPEQLRDSIRWTRTLLLVAEDSGDVIGFVHAVWDPDGNHGDILRLYVHPDDRGEGTGRALFEAVRDELADTPVERLRAMVLEENDSGNAFYRHFGFEWEETEQITIGGETYSENTYVRDELSA
ncbi:MAG: GNAT family N-acetyltransferase [Halovenus sp.]